MKRHSSPLARTLTSGALRLMLPVGLALVCAMAHGQKRRYEPVTGNASYYSDKLRGRKMANGKPYNPDSFTCAHLHYPLGTLLLVRNPKNGKECIVRVTDRGPYTKHRILDLSKAAARYLGIIEAGYMKMEIIPQNEWEVPYPMDEPGPLEKLELNIEYAPKATYPVPVWQKDTLRAEP